MKLRDPFEFAEYYDNFWAVALGKAIELKNSDGELSRKLKAAAMASKEVADHVLEKIDRKTSG